MRVAALGNGPALLEAHVPLLAEHGVTLVQQDADVELSTGWGNARRPAAADGRRVAWVDGAPPRGAHVAPGAVVIAGSAWLAEELGVGDAPVVRPGRDPGVPRRPVPPDPAVQGPLLVRAGDRVARALRRLPDVELVPSDAPAHVAVAPARAVEAFAAGLTVVAVAGTALEEDVRDGHDAVLAAPGVRALKAAVARLAADRVLLHTLRHNAWLSAGAWPEPRQQAGVLAAALHAAHGGRVRALVPHVAPSRGALRRLLPGG